MTNVAMRARAGPLLLFLLASACGEPVRRPDIIVISLDTTRADHLSTYGYGRRTDPFLAEFATQSRVFENAVPSATWTLPSHVSMFSGLEPAEHGCWRHLEDVVDDGALPTVSPTTPLFTSALRAAGYHLVAAVGGPFTSRRYGLLRDFHEVLDPDPDAWELSAAELNAWVLPKLAQRPRERPFLLFLNYFDAHAPYDPPKGRDYPFPEPVAGVPVELAAVAPLEHTDGEVDADLLRTAIDQYDRELLVQDEALREVFGALEREGLLDNVLVVVTADHGEMFGEVPGIYGHGCLPYEPVARVPLIVHRSGGPVGRVTAPVSVSNLANTVLAATGLAPLPDGASARFDLLDLPHVLPPPYVEHRAAGRWVGALRGEAAKYGCAIGPGPRLDPAAGELFLALGPGGEAPRAMTPTDEGWRTALAARLAAFGPEPPDLGQAALTPSELEQMRALGYAGD